MIRGKAKKKAITIYDFVNGNNLTDALKSVQWAYFGFDESNILNNIANISKNVAQISFLASKLFLFRQIKKTNKNQEFLENEIRFHILRTIAEFFMIADYFGIKLDYIHDESAANSFRIILDKIRTEVPLDDLEFAYYSVMEKTSHKKFTWDMIDTEIERYVAIILYFFSSIENYSDLEKFVYNEELE